MKKEMKKKKNKENEEDKARIMSAPLYCTSVEQCTCMLGPEKFVLETVGGGEAQVS